MVELSAAQREALEQLRRAVAEGGPLSERNAAIVAGRRAGVHERVLARVCGLSEASIRSIASRAGGVGRPRSLAAIAEELLREAGHPMTLGQLCDLIAERQLHRARYGRLAPRDLRGALQRSPQAFAPIHGRTKQTVVALASADR